MKSGSEGLSLGVLGVPGLAGGRFLEKWTLSALCVFKNKSEENLAVFLSGADPVTPRPDFAAIGWPLLGRFLDAQQH